MSPSAADYPQIDRLQRKALTVGGALLGVSVILGFFLPQAFFQSYLQGYMLLIGAALGCLAICMLHNLTGGDWGFALRPLLQSGAGTLPLMALLFLPILLGMHTLYEWTNPGQLHGPDLALLQKKEAYLNVPFFIARAVGYFVIWTALAFVIIRKTRHPVPAEGDRIPHALRQLSGPGLALYGLTVSFAAFDWLMSLDWKWFSTIYGLYVMVGQVLLTLAAMTAVAILLINIRPWSGLLKGDQLQDLGNLMMAFIMLWAYMAFSQFLIIWSGNLPEEIAYYKTRLGNGWQIIGLILIIFHFALPFLLLLSRGTKRNMRTLLAVALFVVAMRVVDMFWLTAPAFYADGLAFENIMGLLVPVGLAALWAGVFAFNLKRNLRLLPAEYPPFHRHGDHGEDTHD